MRRRPRRASRWPRAFLALALGISGLYCGAVYSAYFGSVQSLGVAQDNIARGTVFLDVNRNARMDTDETGIAGVAVSNGVQVVRTNSAGRYALPAVDDMNLFITKPAGYAVPVNTDFVPQFHYVHKVAGSPPLRYGGVAPTGPLPAQINFPLVREDIGDEFECLVFGDTQPYTELEVGYVRDTVGHLLASRDNSATACLLFLGDVVGDDLSLLPRLKRITAVGGVPQYFVGGNHDLDLDADSDQHSFDTFRRELGPHYYSFDIGKVHFVVLDNVRYPCNGVDPHPFCAVGAPPSYNGVIDERQLKWLTNDLRQVPVDRLVVVNAHIPFVTFTNANSQKGQTDNLSALNAVLRGRRVLGLAGHTHTLEQILPGEHFDGWERRTGVGPQEFHQVIAGAVSGSWWAGDLNDRGVPHATQRLGAPRGYLQLRFSGSRYVDTFRTFGGPADEQMHIGFNTPRFREWAGALFRDARARPDLPDSLPTVTVNDLGDRFLLSRSDLINGTWAAINVWNGSRASRVMVSLDGAPALEAVRTQRGAGEPPYTGVNFADPFALARQATQGRMTFRSRTGGDRTAGFTTWKHFDWHRPVAGPFQAWMLSDRSSHLWRFDLPRGLHTGVHRLEVVTTDRYARRFREVVAFEVVNSLAEHN